MTTLNHSLLQLAGAALQIMLASIVDQPLLKMLLTIAAGYHIGLIAAGWMVVSACRN